MKASVRSFIEENLSEKFGKPIHISKYESVSGGSINDAYRIETTNGSYFLKLNDPDKFPGMFEAEVKGLQLLADNSTLKIPEFIVLNKSTETSFLVLEYIEAGSKTSASFREFGRLFADMHSHTNKYFGLDQDNYIGSLKQTNSFHSSWSEFFIEERLRKQLKLAFDDRKVNSAMNVLFEKLFKKMDNLFPSEKPSLLHGDLWSGNFMISKENTPCIFDPAVYYGHREMDIAMTKLFGGFDDSFYRAYNEHFPLENGWKERIDLCNLYPLMVHVNLFGGSYVMEVEMILKRFA
ncbi:MAG: fructosamine kinase family protein [Bacteroidetes bacterium]|nr:fructosamine kinase family protein [Bacteroidota bacterium]